MMKQSDLINVLDNPLELPCGAILKNRIAKSPMSDSLADGEGNPTQAQIRLYQRWAQGGAAVSFIGEVQGDPRFPEKPGNLVLNAQSNKKMLQLLTRSAVVDDAHLWPQLGHAGALSHLPISAPKGPSPLNINGLKCDGMTSAEVQDLPSMYANAALYAKNAGFSGVHLHSGHGFLLSQFLSPLFNHRTDGYGGSIEARCRIVLDVIKQVRHTVGPTFPVGIRINSTDQLEGGLTNLDALEVVRLLNHTSIDLIDISGGTYFPGAKASSDGSSPGVYFLDFAKQARELTTLPLMLTGGFKTREQAINAIASGAIDMVGLARAVVLNPEIANAWMSKTDSDPEFPRFEHNIPGGITAWYTMRLTALGEDSEGSFSMDIPSAIKEYDERDEKRSIKWLKKFVDI